MANNVEHTLRRVRGIASPAAGADLSITPDLFGAQQVIGFNATLTTSAAIANRQVTLTIDDGTVTMFRAVASQVQAAGVTVTYQVFLNSPQLALVAGLTLMAFPSEGHLLRRGWRLRTVTSLIDVADQWSAVGLYVQEFPDGPDVIQDPTVPYTEYALDT